jgi:DNA-binding NarL/FixJ family response regulator
MSAGARSLAAGDAGAACARFGTLTAELRRLDAVGMLPTATQWLALAEVVDGRFAAAAVTASEGLLLAETTGRTRAAYFHQAVLAWVAAAAAREEECRERAEAAFHLAALHGHDLRGELVRVALGELELALGRPEAALAQFRLLQDDGSDSVTRLVAPSMVEAAVRADEGALAADAASRYEAVIATPSSPAERALFERCRALLSTGPDADRHFAAAARLHAEAGRTFDRARTELLFGEALRRARRRREAREHLHAALNLFEEVGAESWASRARAELRGSGLSAQRNDPSLLDQLTPQELQVARLVGAGASNKEVAAQLFLSPRTIDFHLRNVFAKLGITSRMQLGWFRLDEETGGFTGATIRRAA